MEVCFFNAGRQQINNISFLKKIYTWNVENNADTEKATSLLNKFKQKYYDTNDNRIIHPIFK